VKTLTSIFKQTSWQLIGKVVTSISTILILGAVTRSYGESGTGIFTLALTFISFFVLAADFGINAHILSRLLKDTLTWEWQKLLGMRLFLASVLTVMAVILALFWPDQSGLFKLTVILGLAAIIEAGVFTTTSAVFQSKLRFDLSILSTITGTLLTLITVFVLIGIKVSIPLLMVGYTLGWIISGVLALIFVREFVGSLRPSLDFTYVKKIIEESWPISATLILNTIYFRADTFMLSTLKNFADVGVYNVSYQIFQSLLVLPTFIMNSFYPLMLKYFAYDRPKFYSSLVNASLLMLAMALSGAFLTIILASWVISLITGGTSFIGSVSSLQILALGFPAFFLSSVLMWVLITYKKYKTMLVIYGVGLIINLILNYLLIPQYSYIASSWITVISEYLILSLQLVILIPAFLKSKESLTSLVKT
jgi:O-antigen/teichoic acid export membrane protein